MRRALVAAVLALAAAGCDDLERMIRQPRYSSYEACPVCPEGTIMMMPPSGAVPRGPVPPPQVATGRVADRYLAEVPIPVDRRLLVRGRNRFEIFCAACHGRLGNGVSQVAENMTLRAPPNLLVPPYTSYPAGRLYAVITEGFGLMRSYAAQLPPGDRWAVVAYLQVLQLSQRAVLDELPPEVRAEAQPWLK